MGMVIGGQWYPTYAGELPPGVSPPPGGGAPPAPVPPSLPPSPPVGSYGGGGSYGQQPTGGEGTPWNTGYGGTEGGVGTPVGPPLGGGMSPQDLAALKWAFEQASQSFGQGQDRLAGGQFMGGALGQGAQSRFLNPTGMDPATLERVKSELAQMFAGSRKDQLANFQGRANASGFGDSQGAQRGMQQIEAQSAQDLVGAITNVLMGNEQFKLQQSGQAAGLAGLLQQLEAQMNQQSAAGYFGRQFPAIPGLGESGGGYQYLDQYGQIKPRPQWTQADWERAMAERQKWVNSGGVAA